MIDFDIQHLAVGDARNSWSDHRIILHPIPFPNRGLCVCLSVKWSCPFQVTSSLSSRTTRTRQRRWPPPTTSSWTSSTPSLSTSSQVPRVAYVLRCLYFDLFLCSDPPYVFGPPGSASGSVSYLYGSGFVHQQAKKLRTTLISTVLWLL